MASIRLSAEPIARPSAYPLLFAQIIAGSLFIALCAQIRIPLPFTPVPITMQNLAVLLIGGFLGSKKGALCAVAYLMESILGLPVLAGGAISPFAIVGPTGGYLIGFIAQAYVMGLFLEQQKQFSIEKTLIGFVAAWFIHMTMGVIWLAQFVGWDLVLTMGFFPFIPGDVLKALIVIPLLKQRFE